MERRDGSLKLTFDIYCLEGRLLLPAGSLIDESCLADLARPGREPFGPPESLMAYASVGSDLKTFLARDPYREIFASEQLVNEIVGILEGVRLVPPVLASLDYFRARDFHTYRHILMVFVLSTLLARDLIENYHEGSEESMAGPIHDFGKVCVPLPILLKRTALTRAEFNILRQHTLAGWILLSYYLGDCRHAAARIALDHHERRDGSGYPRHIALRDPMAEIVAVSDIYDALISPRPYRPTSYDNRTALEELTTMAEHGEVSPQVVKALIAHNRRNRPNYRDVVLPSEKRGTPPEDNAYGVIVEDRESGSL